MLYLNSQGNTYSSHVSLEDGGMDNHNNGNTVCNIDGGNIGGSPDDLGTYELMNVGDG